MTEIVFASHNLGKVKEVQALLHSEEIKLQTMGDVGLHDHMVEENGATYEENAWLKARTVGDLVGKPTLADDSGLEVEALDWKPGVHSARYAKGSDADRRRKLLKEMDGKSNRKARFVAVFVYYDPKSKQKKVFRGEVLGSILTFEKGENGFGYDPVFMPSGYHESMAELGSNEKNGISHRGKVVRAFASWWNETFATESI